MDSKFDYSEDLCSNFESDQEQNQCGETSLTQPQQFVGGQKQYLKRTNRIFFDILISRYYENFASNPFSNIYKDDFYYDNPQATYYANEDSRYLQNNDSNISSKYLDEVPKTWLQNSQQDMALRNQEEDAIQEVLFYKYSCIYCNFRTQLRGSATNHVKWHKGLTKKHKTPSDVLDYFICAKLRRGRPRCKVTKTKLWKKIDRKLLKKYVCKCGKKYTYFEGIQSHIKKKHNALTLLDQKQFFKDQKSRGRPSIKQQQNLKNTQQNFKSKKDWKEVCN